MCDHPLGFRDELSEHIESANVRSRWLTPPGHNDAGGTCTVSSHEPPVRHSSCLQSSSRDQPWSSRQRLLKPQRNSAWCTTAVSPAGSRCCSFGRRDSGLQRRGHGQRRGQGAPTTGGDEAWRSSTKLRALACAEGKQRLWEWRKRGGFEAARPQTEHEREVRARVEAKSDELDGWSVQSAARYKKSTFWKWTNELRKVAQGRGPDAGGYGDEEDEWSGPTLLAVARSLSGGSPASSLWVLGPEPTRGTSMQQLGQRYPWSETAEHSCCSLLADRVWGCTSI